MTARRGWPEDVREACFRLWAGIGARNASRTARLYRAQLPAGDLGPSSATVRRWRVEECWQDWASWDVPPLPVRNTWQWHRMWCRHVLRQMESALTLQRNVLLGTFDSDPGAGVAALTTSAATMEQLLAQPGVRVFRRSVFSERSPTPASLTTRERRVGARLRRWDGAR